MYNCDYKIHVPQCKGFQISGGLKKFRIKKQSQKYSVQIIVQTNN